MTPCPTRLALPLALFAVGVTLAAPASAQKPTPARQQAVHAGQQVFYQHCLICHSVNPGQVMVGPSLAGEMRNSPHKKSAAEIRVILHDGKGKMPPFKDKLSKDDVDHLLAFLGTL
jgi:mono/diheme cytochrome c family protein